MFKELSDESLPQREERILEFWRQQGIFKRSVEERRDRPTFSFYDGPPFATGLPHYGHLLAGTIKDVVPRYKTMKGFCVPRRFGWDCHGLPIESQIEKMHNLSGAADIESFGIPRFNEECRSIVLKYTAEWRATVERMARWVDFDHVYHTMDPTFMESVWWVFKQVFQKNLVYKGYKVMPYSAQLGTALSNFEAGENYKEVDDPSLTVTFPLKEDQQTALLAWTTTPWTLPSNLALMVQPEADYVEISVSDSSTRYILAEARLKEYYKDESSYEVTRRLRGRDLVGLTYQPLFDYFAEEAEKGAFRVIAEESVTMDEGTGIVHCAPGFGEVDFYACKEAGIDLVCPIDGNGRFTKEIPEYEGQFVKEADKALIRHLKEAGRVVRHATYRHRYPFCPRSDTPLIYRVVDTWFVAVEKVKERMVQLNQEVHWTPGYIKEKRFGKWLEGARDWAISRSRYWGTPIPLWIAEDGDILCIGSVGELEDLTGEKISDLHRHFIDQLSFEKDGKRYRRIPDVFDCWFESGSMPYAQRHYPFENEQRFQETFPADFIAEGLDQTRGWFYTLMVLSTILFDKPAYKNVVVNGIILAEDGAKMSKRLRNYPDPTEMIDRYGADAIRLYMLHSPAVKGDDLAFAERGVELVLRQILIPWWNAYSFFLTYARLYNWQPAEDTSKPEKEIDRWILSMLNKLVHDVEQGMDVYDLSRAVEPLVGFVDHLTNWYIRRSRRRFWEAEDSSDRRQAFATLYEVLMTLAKVAAPFVPFFTESMYLNLRREDMPESVHLCDCPEYQELQRDLELEASMAAVQTAVSLGHGLRKEQRLKVRQPLAAVHVASGEQSVLDALRQHERLIAEELNVKEVRFSDKEEEFVSLSAKPNFRTLGQKVGKLMPKLQKVIRGFERAELLAFQEGESMLVTVEGEEIQLTPEDVQVQREVKEHLAAANQGAITLALETQLDDALKLEGLAREIVNKVNTMRRDAGLEVSDRIELCFQTTDRVKECFAVHGDYIRDEVLAIKVIFHSCEGTKWDLNGEEATIALTKAAMV